MRIHNRFSGTKGWLSTYERVVRFRHMITDEAKKRVRILAFWQKHGLEAAKEAFGVSRRSLFSWQAALKKGGGKLESLNPGSRVPKKKRVRAWPLPVLEEVRRLRELRPNLGKDKLHPLLRRFCSARSLPCPSVRTVGRLIRDMGGLRRVPQYITGTGRIVPPRREKALRKPKGLTAEYPGHVVALDTIERIMNGTRRYIITAEDLFGRFSFAWATSSHASKAAAEFFAVFLAVFPYPVTFALTDNGSEFKKLFAEALEKLQIVHFRTRPRTPKQNAHIERFNRTIQEEFVDFNRGLLLDTDRFNAALMDWLVWYNCERVHHAFGNKLSPVEFLLSLEPSALPKECRSGWPYTTP